MLAKEVSLDQKSQGVVSVDSFFIEAHCTVVRKGQCTVYRRIVTIGVRVAPIYI